MKKKKTFIFTFFVHAIVHPGGGGGERGNGSRVNTNDKA